MFSNVLNFIAEYGLDAVLLALLINIITGVLKLPLKAYAKKLENGERITRFLVFLPMIFGFGFSVTYRLMIGQAPLFGESFFNLWLSSSSLSLTFYAIWEKIFPGTKKLMRDCEVQANRNLLNVLQTIINTKSANGKVASELSDSKTA